MAYPDKINALVDIAGTSTLAVVGHAARHNDLNDALDELKVVLTVPAANTLALAPGGTERLRIDSSGNVGIGTTGAASKFEVNGAAAFAAGTAALPGITTTGDLNTGVLFPAADTVAVSTGGTERLRVTSAGNVFGVAAQNLLINGGFDVWQRGTSFTMATNSQYSADRWLAGGNTGTFSRQSFAVDTITGYQPKYFARWDITANSQNYELSQRIEGVRTLSGQRATVSFWAKSTSSVTVSVRGTQEFGTGGSPSGAVVFYPVSGGQNISFTSTWTRYSYQLDVPSISGKTLGTAGDDCLRFGWQVTNTSTGAIDTWGWQVEEGPIASAFQVKTFGQQLLECQRYFETSFAEGTTPADNISSNQMLTTCNTTLNNSYTSVFFQVKKRASPSVKLYSSTSSTSDTWRWYNAVGSTVDGGVVDASTRSQFVLYQGDATRNVVVGHYTASSEL
jgi:hypothetical protein